jgi:hypothetical protein
MSAVLRIVTDERPVPEDFESDQKVRDLIAEIGRTRRLPDNWAEALDWPINLEVVTDDGVVPSTRLPLRHVDSGDLRQAPSRGHDDYEGGVLLFEALEMADVDTLGELQPEHVAAYELYQLRGRERRRVADLYTAWATGRINNGGDDITVERFLEQPFGAT